MFRDSAQTPGGSLKSLCCVCAAELGQAPGTEAAPGNQEELQKHIAPNEQLFSQHSRAGALPAATLGTAQRDRELQSVWAGKCSEVTGAESLPALDTQASGCRTMQLQLLQ